MTIVTIEHATPTRMPCTVTDPGNDSQDVWCVFSALRRCISRTHDMFIVRVLLSG